MQSHRFLRPLWPSLTIRISPRPTSASPPSLRPVPRTRPFSQTHRLRLVPNWPRPPPRDTTRRSYHNVDPRHRLSQAKPLVTSDGLRRFARSPSLHTVVVLSVLGAVAFYFGNLQTVPVSGRRRFNCFSDATVEAASEAQVKRIVYEVERAGGRFLDDWDPRMRLVKRVMKRLIPVSGMEKANWEITVIDDPRT